MASKAALAAAVCLFVSVLLGIMLGGYTIGGFHSREAPDTLAAYAPDRGDAAVTDTLAMAPAIAPERAHVCRGCDAHPYRFDWQDSGAAIYVQDESPVDADAEAPVRFVDGWQADAPGQDDASPDGQAPQQVASAGR